MQKVIRVIDDNMTSLDVYLNHGWEVKQMSACRLDGSLCRSACYILIETIETK